MLRAISRVEQAATNRHEGVIIVAFQEPVAVAVDDRDGVRVGDGHVIRLDAYELPKFFMGFVDGGVALALSALKQEPEVCEGCDGGGGDGA